MSNIANQFLTKLESLPPEAQFYFDSEFLGLKIKDLSSRYGLADTDINELVYLAVAGDFNFASIDNHEVFLGIKDDVLKKQLISDFWGAIILPVAGYVGIPALAGAIKSRLGDWQRYTIDINELEEELKDEHSRVMEELAIIKDEITDINEEVNVARSLFANGLLYVLQNNDDNSIFDLNAGLVYLLNKEPSLKDELAEFIIENQEKLSEKTILIDGKQEQPTVANWLKDFMQKQGGGNINNLAVTQYLTNSENAKILDREQKTLLGDVLELYRNIKFFPESMKDVPPEQWFIVPVEPLFLESVRKKAGTNKIDASKPLLVKSPQNVRSEKVDVEPMPQPIVNPTEARRKELQLMAETFPVGSLERRALEQEIASLNK